MAQPNDVFTINDIRAAATAKLDSRWAQYINEGSMDLITVKANEAAYDRYRIMPRILRDVAEIDTTTTIFGSKASFPFGFSPAAMHCLAHPDGEIATSRAAAKTGIAMGLSHWATKSLEDVIAAGQEINPSTPYAIQTSSANPKHHTASLLARASKAGYKAVLRRRERLLVGVDGGIRRGSDVFKALALGADVCFAGRVPLWGLAWAGREGVERAVGILRDEFETCMRLAGCRSLADIGPECLAVVEGGVPGLTRRLPKL
ncbi:putative fmn-dependent dehydrogenase family protein [Neofusicoccum parvum UCRNP2]|uniref:Putative fmn-dependent dehydrogenase family protein n=1 Tax=Botryosphaeria parva (strain UCR-NP2) TaxID=1287680 RepID=R1H0R7_BOTPV|nr:putative fmn-dependent dehydrogenase family protein [Neofusicoccum parvum UCRNP2]